MKVIGGVNGVAVKRIKHIRLENRGKQLCVFGKDSFLVVYPVGSPI